uniref:Protein msta, isoform A n=1 Tax=Cacopsylla melanoneura TaxID=428564 RepID=A0A8D8X7D0_9HEMI
MSYDSYEEQQQLDELSLEKLLQLHLNCDLPTAWTIHESYLHGRGLFATRDIEEGEVIFKDEALVLGPRSGTSCLPVCVGCFSSSELLHPCTFHCRLPVCSSTCQNSPQHQIECEFLGEHKGLQTQDMSERETAAGLNGNLVNGKTETEVNEVVINKEKDVVAKVNENVVSRETEDVDDVNGNNTEAVREVNGHEVNREKESTKDVKGNVTIKESKSEIKVNEENKSETELNGNGVNRKNCLDEVNGNVDSEKTQALNDQVNGNLVNRETEFLEDVNGDKDSAKKQAETSTNANRNVAFPQYIREIQHTKFTIEANGKVEDNRGDGAKVNWDLLRAVTPLRCLKMSKLKRKIMKALESKHFQICEVDLLKRHLSRPLTSSEEAYLRLCCGILNTNVYGGSGGGQDKKSLNFRGLYALSAIMNHCCRPNTTYWFDSDQRMVVKASSKIRAGEEILSTYSSLLWGTAVRRSFLRNTKEFECTCLRCKDPTEFGSNLSAIYCKVKSCPGLLLPSNPRDIKSDWTCSAQATTLFSNHTLNAHKVFPLINIYSKVAQMLTESEDLAQIDKFLRSVPEFAQPAIQIRKHFVLHSPGEISDVSDAKLEFKEESCHKLLEILTKLGLGSNYLRGLILREMHAVLQEKSNRFPKLALNQQAMDKIRKEYETILSF